MKMQPLFQRPDLNIEIISHKTIIIAIKSPAFKMVTFRKYNSLPSPALKLEPIMIPVIIILTASRTTLKDILLIALSNRF